jgi:hypothetical protein
MKPTPPKYRVIVSWHEYEVSREGGRGARHLCGEVHFPGSDTLNEAKKLLARARMNNGWAPADIAHDVEVELHGEGLPQPPVCSPPEHAKGMAMVREALAKCPGPLLKGLHGSEVVPRSSADKNSAAA